MYGREVYKAGVRASYSSSMPSARPENEPDLVRFDRRYRAALMTFFIRRVRDRAEAEDLTQEVFARLAADSGRRLVHADAYVFQTAGNLLRDRGRRKKVRSDYLAEIEQDSGDTLGPERVLAARQSLAQVVGALQELSERTRVIFVLHRLEKLRKAEIAAMFGISVSGVDKHLIKAMIHLHDRLREDP